MATISVSLPSDGETIDVADYNTPINTIVTAINGNLDNANIATSAAIAGSKLADGAITNDKQAAGVTVQTVSTNYANLATGTTIMPFDDTIPQITEGDIYMAQAITPKSATNLLVIEAKMMVSNSVAAKFVSMALFQDSTANALSAVAFYGQTATEAESLTLTYVMTAGTTSQTTFQVRAGGENAGTTTFNGVAGARRFGTAAKSNITVREVKA